MKKNIHEELRDKRRIRRALRVFAQGAAMFAIALLFMVAGSYAQMWMTQSEPVGEITATSTEKEIPKKELTHQQMVWSYAIEWCESRGKISAVNPKDRDGTPSYGAYQFKPETLVYYSDMFAIERATSTMDYSTQRSVFEEMIRHADEVNWSQQFPDCVKKFGPPPRR